MTLTSGRGFDDHHAEVLASPQLRGLGFIPIKAGSHPSEAQVVEGLKIALQEALGLLARDHLLVGTRRKLPAATVAATALGLEVPPRAHGREATRAGAHLLTARRESAATELRTTSKLVQNNELSALIEVARVLLGHSADPPRLSRHLAPSEQDRLRRTPHRNAQPVTLESYKATYALKGRTIVYGITERVIRAEAEVDHYDVTARSYPNPDDRPVLIDPVYNCRTRSTHPLRKYQDEMGGKRYELRVFAPQPLGQGDVWPMATRVRWPSGANDVPIANVSITSWGIERGGLTLRLQFDKRHIPAAIWYYADPARDSDRFAVPEYDAPERLDERLSTFGYLEWRYDGFAHPGAKYGVCWEW